MKPKLLFATFVLSTLGPLQANPDQPPIHTATATVQIHYPKNGATSDRFLQNQIVILTAGNTLDEAAKNSGVNRATLTKSVKVRPIKGTDIVYLDATHPAKDKAKAIVQSVIDAYSKQRIARTRGDQSNQLHSLDHAIKTQSDLVIERRKELTILIQQYGIPFFEANNASPMGTTEHDMLKNARTKLDSLQIQRDQLTIQIKKLVEAKNEDLIRYAAGLDLPENQVTRHFQKHREANLEIENKIAAGFAGKHPEIATLRKRSKESLDSARKEIAILKKVLATKLELVSRQIERMSGLVKDHQDSTVDLALRQHVYNQAKEHYEAARITLRELKTRKQKDRLTFESPRKTVTIHGWSHQ